MTTNHSSENLEFNNQNVTDVYPDELGLQESGSILLTMSVKAEMITEFRKKFPSVYKSFREQQDRDLLEFIKVYSTNRGNE